MKILLLNASPKNYGATQEILMTLQQAIPKAAQTELICLGDLNIGYCRGCKVCYKVRECVVKDDMWHLMEKLQETDALVIAAPSYWGDVPGIFKSFIDRCTPYSNTSPDPLHANPGFGKRCYGIALRTGTRPGECEHILAAIEHWCGHMGVEMADGIYFCQVENKEDIGPHKELLRKKAEEWFPAEKL